MTAEEFLKQYHDNNPNDWLYQKKQVIAKLLNEYASQQRTEVEFEICECGHTAPIGYIHYDQNAVGTCINCFNDKLIFRLGKKNKQIKRLREKVKKQQIACIRLGFEAARLVDNSI